MTTLVHSMNRRLEGLFLPTDRSIYLAIFRIYLGFHIVKKMAFQWPHLDLLYSRQSFLVWSDTLWGGLSTAWVQNNYMLVNIIVITAAVLMMFGIGRRLTIAVVFIFQELLHQVNGYCLDGGDNLLKFLLLYLILCNSFTHFSLSQPAYSGRAGSMDRFFTNLGVACMILHLCLAYFISGISKANAEVWYHGTAVYYIFQLDRFQGTSVNPWLVQNAFLVTFATYSTLIWEVGFSFCIWIKRLRICLLAFGVMLHLGIYVFMMINEFQILFLMIYGFFFTDRELLRFCARLPSLGKLALVQRLQQGVEQQSFGNVSPIGIQK